MSIFPNCLLLPLIGTFAACAPVDLAGRAVPSDPPPLPSTKEVRNGQMDLLLQTLGESYFPADLDCSDHRMTPRFDLEWAIKNGATKIIPTPWTIPGYRDVVLVLIQPYHFYYLPGTGPKLPPDCEIDGVEGSGVVWLGKAEGKAGDWKLIRTEIERVKPVWFKDYDGPMLARGWGPYQDGFGLPRFDRLLGGEFVLLLGVRPSGGPGSIPSDAQLFTFRNQKLEYLETISGCQEIARNAKGEIVAFYDETPFERCGARLEPELDPLVYPDAPVVEPEILPPPPPVAEYFIYPYSVEKGRFMEPGAPVTRDQLPDPRKPYEPDSASSAPAKLPRK